MNLDEIDTKYVASLIPDKAIPTGLLSVVTWLNVESGKMEYRVWMNLDMDIASALGSLELAKADVLSRAFGGLPNTTTRTNGEE